MRSIQCHYVSQRCCWLHIVGINPEIKLECQNFFMIISANNLVPSDAELHFANPAKGQQENNKRGSFKGFRVEIIEKF